MREDKRATKGLGCLSGEVSYGTYYLIYPICVYAALHMLLMC